MSVVSKVLRRHTLGFAHWCPGCKEMHTLPDSWTFNGNVDKPTFTPSFRHSGMKRVLEYGRWTGHWYRDADGNPIPHVCHYILTAGQLEFCSDSTHDLAGQTVPLPELPEMFTSDFE